jgi:predicted RNase H-like HicB family nuclease
MHYAVVLHKDQDSDYGVTVPDLPGCFSAGSTVDEALTMAKEAIELHLEGLIEEGQPIPASRGIEAHRSEPEYAQGTWALVSVDTATLRTRAKRINITMPERILDAVDSFAAAAGETRSGLLALAATEYISRHRPTSGSRGKGR